MLKVIEISFKLLKIYTMERKVRKRTSKEIRKEKKLNSKEDKKEPKSAKVRCKEWRNRQKEYIESLGTLHMNTVLEFEFYIRDHYFIFVITHL